MSYFLVDFENTHSGGLNNFKKLTENDTVEIFYSDSVNSMTFDLHTRILTCPSKFIYTKITNGTKNALDFILLTQLACKISENTDENYFIISKDKGFDVICDWWREKKVRVARIEEISRFEYALNRLNGAKPAAEQPADEPAEDTADPAEPVEEIPTEEATAESAAENEAAVTDNTPAENTAETAPAETDAVKAENEPEAAPAADEAAEPEKSAEETAAAAEEIKPEAKPKQTNRRQAKKPAGKNAARNKKQPAEKQPTEDKTAENKTRAENRQPEKNANAEITAQLAAAGISDAAEVADTVILYIEKYKTKQGIHNALVKKYPSKDNEKAAGIYKAIKGFISDKK